MEKDAPRGTKRKLTRKQQLAESRRLKARFKSERDDAEYVPEPAQMTSGWLPPDCVDDDMCREEPGAACKRQSHAYNQRRSKERLRGDTKASASMRAWLRYDPAKERVGDERWQPQQYGMCWQHLLMSVKRRGKKAAAAAAERQRSEGDPEGVLLKYIVLGTTISTALPKRDIRRPRP